MPARQPRPASNAPLFARVFGLFDRQNVLCYLEIRQSERNNTLCGKEMLLLWRITTMKLTPQITFKDIPRSDAVETAILEKVSKLERYSDRIMGCRIAVEAVQQPMILSEYLSSLETFSRIAVSTASERGMSLKVICGVSFMVVILQSNNISLPQSVLFRSLCLISR